MSNNKQSMKKVLRDGKVGVLISTGWGAGFLTWGAPLEAIFDPELIYLVETHKHDDMLEYVQKTYPDAYTGGLDDLLVVWVDEGTEFFIDEYDGSESIVFKSSIDWITA